ncbi:skp1-protein-hydroxyproline N-acetylglucosaminyltransferase-like [Rhagoletis pomonella]|uniref:skp1-protein-hydroxyproline N-acetylglucosaminyltransferase-like n=1 Tax=Rhagoletis pomonella TaxID=28610 RepID=UPI00177EB11C|nr:skp1-protein-hydroxyproline N-acetylglucosaminyltransferase-like [Rhagoletis pomonella]
MTQAKAHEMAVEQTINVCRLNSRSDMVKSILASSTFSDSKDVVAKMIVEHDNIIKERQVLAFRSRPIRTNNFRGGYRGSNNYRYHNNNFRFNGNSNRHSGNTSYRNNNQNRNNSFSNRRNNYNNSNNSQASSSRNNNQTRSNTRNSANVRTLNAKAPQARTLGELDLNN